MSGIRTKNPNMEGDGTSKCAGSGSSSATLENSAAKVSWTLVCSVLVATVVLSLLHVDIWWIPIGDFPRVQLLVACVVAMIILVLVSRWCSLR